MLQLTVVVILLIIALLPFCFIWALNTLFNMSIPFNIWTWLAALLLSGAVTHPTYRKKGQ